MSADVLPAMGMRPKPNSHPLLNGTGICLRIAFLTGIVSLSDYLISAAGIYLFIRFFHLFHAAAGGIMEFLRTGVQNVIRSLRRRLLSSLQFRLRLLCLGPGCGFHILFFCPELRCGLRTLFPCPGRRCGLRILFFCPELRCGLRTLFP